MQLAKSAAPAPKILAPEVLGVHYERAEKYAAPMNFDFVYGLAHHLYERGDDGIWDWRSPGPDSYVKHMQGAASVAHGKPIFQTEFQTDDDNGTDIPGKIELTLNGSTSVPEPASLALLGSAAVGFGVMRRRRRNRE